MRARIEFRGLFVGRTAVQVARLAMALGADAGWCERVAARVFARLVTWRVVAEDGFEIVGWRHLRADEILARSDRA